MKNRGSMTGHDQRGISTSVPLFIVLILFVAGVFLFVRQQANKTNQLQTSAEKSLAAENALKKSSNSSSLAKDTPTEVTLSGNAAVKNFYDCNDQAVAKNGTSSATCTYNSVKYTKPTAFTTDMIRGLDKVPAGALGGITKVAKATFDCPFVSTVTIYGVDDNFVYYGAGCDGGYRGIIAKAADWSEIVQSQANVSCETITKYKIPEALFANGNPAQTDCYDASGAQHDYPTF